MPAKRYCCVIGCNNSEQNSRQLKFYSFPRKSHDIDRRKKWIQAVRRVGADNKPWEANINSRICSAHFVGGAKSTIENSPSYIPTIFPPIYKKRALSQAAAARHDRLRKRKISNPSEVHVEAIVQENVETANRRWDQLVKVAHIVTMKEEPKEINYDSLELIGLPKCMDVKMEDSDISQKIVAERIGNIDSNLIIKDEDEGILTEDIDDWSVDQTSEDTTITYSVETMKIECHDDDVFEEKKIDIKLEDKILKDMDISDSIDTKEDVIVRAIKQEELTIKSENEDFYEDNLNDDVPASLTSSNSCASTDYRTKGNAQLQYCQMPYMNLSGMVRCEECGYQTRNSRNFRRHQLQHRDSSEVQMFVCDECSYQTKYKDVLKRHKLCHKESSEVEMFECGECDFETKHKTYLKTHTLLHKELSDAEMLHCGECDYQTKHRRKLTIHKLRHKADELFSCSHCNYRTVYKRNYESHKLRHKDDSEVEFLDCGECDFRTKYKKDLKLHRLRHRDSSEVEMFCCPECDYQTKIKDALKRHKLRHKESSKVKMFHCCDCDYQTRYKRNLDRHSLHHKESSQIPMLSCSECEYQTKTKSCLKRHQLQHVESSEMLTCDQCDYRTKHKIRLKSHKSLHQVSSEVKIFSCGMCEYQTVYKKNLKRHQFIHEKSSDVKTFRCGKCNFQTMYKRSLAIHRLQHRESSEVELNGCGECD